MIWWLGVAVSLLVIAYTAAGFRLSLYLFRKNPGSGLMFFGAHMVAGASGKIILSSVDFEFKHSPTWESVAGALRITPNSPDNGTITMMLGGLALVVVGAIIFQPESRKRSKPGWLFRVWDWLRGNTEKRHTDAELARLRESMKALGIKPSRRCSCGRRSIPHSETAKGNSNQSNEAISRAATKKAFVVLGWSLRLP